MSLDLISQAAFGWDRVAPGGTQTGDFSAIAVFGTPGKTAKFANGCIATEGDAPANGDLLAAGVIMPWPLTTVILDATSECPVFLARRVRPE